MWMRGRGCGSRTWASGRAASGGAERLNGVVAAKLLGPRVRSGPPLAAGWSCESVAVGASEEEGVERGPGGLNDEAGARAQGGRATTDDGRVVGGTANWLAGSERKLLARSKRS